MLANLIGKKVLIRLHMYVSCTFKLTFLYTICFLILFAHVKDSLPVGAVQLAGYNVSRTPDSGCSHSFRLSKKGSLSVNLAVNSNEKLELWLKALTLATAQTVSKWTKTLIDLH